MMRERTEEQSKNLAVLRHGIEAQYGLQVHSIVRMRSVYGVVCTDGSRWIWKALGMHVTPQRLMAINRVATSVQHVGIDCAGPVFNRIGRWTSALEDGTVGYLQPWLNGRHVNLLDTQERLSALATVAHFHRVSSQVPLHDIEGIARLPLFEKIRLKIDQFKRLWPRAVAEAPRLGRLEDTLFSVLADIQRAVHQSMQIEWAQSPPVFCHRDLAPHNLLWRDRPQVAIIDFDMAGLDDPFVDVMQWSNHTVFLGGAGAGHFRTCVQVYDRIYPLSAERRAFLWKLLRFPDILIRAVSEWAKAEDDASVHANRLRFAAQKEQLRWSLWSEDVLAR